MTRANEIFTDVSQGVGDFLLEQRKARGWSVLRAAKTFKTSTGSIINAENRGTTPRVSTALINRMVKYYEEE